MNIQGGGLSYSVSSDEEMAIDALFPTKSKAKRLQMVTELTPSMIVPLTALGLIKRKFGSKVIELWEDELYTKLISRDRKGRLEMSEIFVAGRSRRDSEED